MEHIFKEQPDLKETIQGYLGKEITKFTLKGKGACNYAYYIETQDGARYIVKREREDAEASIQNNLLVEASVAQQFYRLGLSIPTPRVVFVSEQPRMYGYEYIEGEMMRGIWKDLSEEQRIDICRNLGRFHAELGQKVTKQLAQKLGVQINESTDLHPEVLKEYTELVMSEDVPETFKILARRARKVFEDTRDRPIFQFLHNDAHHENILIQDARISGIIDYDDAEYGEITKEFSRYIRDYPAYFPYIVAAYEEASGNKLSYQHLISNAFLSGFDDIVEDYRKGGIDKANAEKMVSDYEKLMSMYP